MSVTFNFAPVESTASPLYKVNAVDSQGHTVMSWHIATDDESQLPVLAQEAYTLAISPKPYEKVQP